MNASHMTLAAPELPFALFSSLTVIDRSTSVDQARLWQSEMEAAYNSYFRDPDPSWTWDDIHDCDRDVLVELEEVIRASHQPPLDMDIVASFSAPDWRLPYQKQLFSQYCGSAQLGCTTVADIPLEEQIQWQRARGILSSDGDISSEDEVLLHSDWRQVQAIFESTRADRLRSEI